MKLKWMDIILKKTSDTWDLILKHNNNFIFLNLTKENNIKQPTHLTWKHQFTLTFYTTLTGFCKCVCVMQMYFSSYMIILILSITKKLQLNMCDAIEQ